jgi:CRP-like cAMP-binding protein
MPTAVPPKRRPLSLHPVLTALHNSAWFANSSDETLAALSSSASLFSFSKKERVLCEGRWSGAAVLVVQGSLHTVRRSEQGRELILETFRAGALIPDANFTCDETLSSDWLVAGETSLLLFIPRDEFQVLLSTSAQAAMMLVRDLEKRLQRVKMLASGLATADVEKRLHLLLYNLARDEGPLLPGGAVIPCLPTQQDLASRIGACRETVSRILAELVRQGNVSLVGRRATLAPRFLEIAKLHGMA